MRRFEGKVALVTGAASGMGRATSLRLASEGAGIFGVDIDESGLAKTASEIRAASGRMEEHVCDIRRRQSCFEAVDAAVTAFGRLDVLANVAGIVRFHHSPEMSEEEWNQLMAVNLSAPFFLSQAAIPHLLESGGNIINVASNAGLMGQAYTVAYCASKGALIQLTRALAMEYVKRGIRINAVCPGATDTEMNKGIELPEGLDWKLIKRYTSLRGFSPPEDIAAAIAFVASDEAGAIHGSIFSADGGMSAG